MAAFGTATEFTAPQRDAERDGGSKRRVFASSLKHIARLECPSIGISGVREFAQPRRNAIDRCIERRAGNFTARRTERLGKVDGRFAWPCMSELDDGLACRDNLTGLANVWTTVPSESASRRE
jgi:hypothetical protein